MKRPTGTETRIVATDVSAVDDKKFEITGLAAVYNSPSHNLGGFIETVAPSAFKRALRDKHDVRILVEHDPSKILGRTAAGTASLSDSPEGLRFLCRLDPTQQLARDTWAQIKRGDRSQCSFAFSAPENGQVWNGNKRTLTDVDLIDCSVVCMPAYEATSVEARSHYSVPVPVAQNATSLAEMRAKMLRQRTEIFRTWPKEWGFAPVRDERGNVVDFRCVTAEERDAINRDRVRFLGKQIAFEQRAASECECDCPECEEGNCAECSNKKCTDDACEHDED